MKISFIKFIPGIAWFFVVLYLVCLPNEEIPKISWLMNINFDKVVHIGVFGLLTILFCWPFYKSNFAAADRINYFIKIAIATSVWGLATEFIQRFWIPGRSFDLFDWASDTIGALLAYWVCRKNFLQL
jgi:VanZ family protein